MSGESNTIRIGDGVTQTRTILTGNVVASAYTDLATGLNVGLSTACAMNQVMQWYGSNWACASVSGGGGGSGTVTSVGTGLGLTGGPITTFGTLAIDTGVVPQLGKANNSFTGTITLGGNLALPYTTSASAGVITVGGQQFLHSYGYSNTFVGASAGNMSLTGIGNSAVGSSALPADTSGGYNSAIGEGALFRNTTGSNNNATGASALLSNTTGSFNTADGQSALYFNNSGSYNTALGFQAGAPNTSSMQSNLTGSMNTFIGFSSGPGTPTQLNNATAIGANAMVNVSNALVLGSTGVSVGIGTPSPAATLDVEGGDANFGHDVVVGNNVTIGNDVHIKNTLTIDGNVSIGNTGINASIGADGSANFKGNVAIVGDLAVNGTVSKGGGSFKIDHPLDPAGKYLSHSFVESPDMMNVYNGNVVTDQHGMATVVLPDYFEALNGDFRYQLTVIGQFAQAIVAKKVEQNRFVIRTNKPKVEVSWQITGIRQDAYANAHRIPVEEEKPRQEQGRYLHPELFGAPPELAVGYHAPAAGAHAAQTPPASPAKNPSE
jgi:hypothetical protein